MRLRAARVRCLLVCVIFLTSARVWSQEGAPPTLHFAKINCTIQSYAVCTGTRCTSAPAPIDHEFASDTSIVFDFLMQQYTYNYRTRTFDIVHVARTGPPGSLVIDLSTRPLDGREGSSVRIDAQPEGDGWAVTFSSSREVDRTRILSGGRCVVFG